MERRSEHRARTRLRPGKLLSGDGRHLGDCAILDLSPQGARVRAFVTAAGLPDDLVLFEEAGGRRWPARRAWASGPEAGLHLSGPPKAVSPDEWRRIAGPFYAVA